MKVVIAEKRDQAKSIAEAMGWRLKGSAFEGELEGEAVQMLWASGHLLTLKGPEEINPEISWQDPKPLRPIPRRFEMRAVVNPGSKNPKAAAERLEQMRKALKGASEAVIATDSDREGEAIGWHILEHAGYRGPVRRAWLAKGLDTRSIREAFSALRAPEETRSWYRASEARARSDWAFIFLVRAYTFYAGYSCMGSNLGRGRGRSGVVSVGRVQTPALAMIVRRDREIESFVPVDHFTVSGDFTIRGEGFRAQYDPEVDEAVIESAPPGVHWEAPKATPKDGEKPPLDKPLFVDRERVEAFRERLMGVADQARVTGYDEGSKSEEPPKPFELATAQQTLARAFNISASLAQTVLEDLYEQGWTSYPRTSHPELPANLYERAEREGLIAACAGVPDLAAVAERARAIHAGEDPNYRPRRPKCFTDKAMEHHGIIPTHQAMDADALASLTPRKAGTGGRVQHTREHMQYAWQMVAERFLQALYPPARYATQSLTLTLPCEDLLGHREAAFRARGRRLEDPGWRAAFERGASEDVTLPATRAGEAAVLHGIELDAQRTRPPARYTETDFPVAMKNVSRQITDPRLRKHLKNAEGIGTPATRSKIIETLKARGYIEVGKGSRLASLAKGRDLIDRVPGWLASPETTAVWEDFLIQLCEERDDERACERRDQFVNKQIDLLERLLAELEDTHLGNLGPRQVASDTVSRKKADYIRALAKKKGLELPKGTLSDPMKAQAFLDEHAPKRDPNDHSPSEGQRQFAERIIAALPEGVTPPEDALTDRQACSRFIEAHKDYLPPTEKMIALARRLSDEMPADERPGEAVFQHANACREFLDARLGGRKGGAGGKGAPKGRSGSGRAGGGRATGGGRGASARNGGSTRSRRA